MLLNEKILIGGDSNSKDLYISPTLIDEPTMESAVMKEEIFGPILPIITYKNEKDIEVVISNYDKPLSMYIFSSNTRFIKKIIRKYSFGGGCINDTVIHFANKRLPFGGIGDSGIGAYHGKLNFDVFSHHKAIVKKATWLDIQTRYAPYKGKLAILKKMLNWMS